MAKRFWLLVSPRNLRIAVLIKQVPSSETLHLGSEGRLVRAGLLLEMNAYCRRAVSKGVELAQSTGGSLEIITLGPPSAEDVLREGVAWGLDRGADVRAVHLCDPAFAGSDTLATARALATVLACNQTFDLILVGRNSLDSDTGQVGPELAELLGLPFVAGVKKMTVMDKGLDVTCERDDGWLSATVAFPAVVSVAERLCRPAKVSPAGRELVPSDRITTLAATEVGLGPFGQAGSPTSVGRVRVLDVPRLQLRLEGGLPSAVRETVSWLANRGALNPPQDVPPAAKVPAHDANRLSIGVVVLLEPGRFRSAQELLGQAATLASEGGGRVLAIGVGDQTPAVLSSWGADEVLVVDGAEVEEDLARAATPVFARFQPWAGLAPSTLWGREIAARVAARLGAGLTGDAIALEVDDGKLIAWKPAFAGHVVAAIHASTPMHLVTVRPGVLAPLGPRQSREIPVRHERVAANPRLRLVASGQDDDLDALARASKVVGVGAGVRPEEYSSVVPLLEALGAELGGTRKVTDLGWQPRSRQIGTTGRSITPVLYVAIGLQGTFHHMAGVRGAQTVLAINADGHAPVFEAADIGIVGDWHEVVPLLVSELTDRRETEQGRGTDDALTGLAKGRLSASTDAST
jgi:electron transfer flavoprotein alpha subunit